ncbi:MAG: alpha-D-ribose 1-methylphosphonate 5-triphosphate diphosphatase [Proteobacteria bacterium]|nr:alpha-D-ribose 1-methylphosphonate 5-triphosphate diphosphatase [Pseudomonadota bacterium]
MSETLVLSNAEIVTADQQFRGYVVVQDGRIAEIGEGRPPEKGIDLDGDFLLPGLVELHTDHLEVHFMPRPKVEWPAISAVLAHDAQVIGSGITTVFDALRVGNDYDDEKFGARMKKLAEAIAAAKGQGLTRAEHFVHLRCEISCADAVEEMQPFLTDPQLKLVSVMDHTPGQRQFTDVSKWKTYYAGKRGASEAEMNERIVRRRAIHEQYAEINRREIVRLCRSHGVTLASHDDATVGHVQEAVADGMHIAEFPTTLEAAQASHEAGLKVLMGAPNVVRGGSHSGNVSARTLAENGVLDVLSSDYVPTSLLMGAFALGHVPGIGGLPGAIRLVSKNPAEASGLADRGEIASGKRADLIRVDAASGQPVLRAAWREGSRVS